jgi:hypothetical protein
MHVISDRVPSFAVGFEGKFETITAESERATARGSSMKEEDTMRRRWLATAVGTGFWLASVGAVAQTVQPSAGQTPSSSRRT